MATGDLHLLGTLYTGNTKRLMPTNPVNGGNITPFVAGQAIEIRNTDPADAYKLRWREVIVGAKRLLVADRNILHSVSWDDLNAQGLVAGKEITIDGQQYKLRLMTVGSNYRSGTDAYSGGSPAANEWDQIITNEANHAGLPKPIAADLTGQNAAGVHNQFWNWGTIYSWAQEVYSGSGTSRALRGYFSARYWSSYSSSNRTAGRGFRPVLEVLNSSPLISGGTQNLGNKTAPFSVVYQVSDPENDAVNVVEKLNGTTIRTVSGIAQGANQEVVITLSQWAAIPLNSPSTITIEATDSKGALSTRVYTFTKTNAPPTATAVEPKGDLSNIAIVDTLTPIFVHAFNDVDAGDTQSAYQYIIEDLNDTVVHDSGKKLSTQTFYQLAEAAKLEWGKKYKWKVRVWDRFDVPSEYSFAEFILPNRAPNITNLQPGSNDPDAPLGAGMAPEFSWDFEDLDLESQTAYQIQIFKTSDNALAYDSSKVNNNLQKHQVPVGRLGEGTAYYAIVTVWDPNGLHKDSERAYFQTNATPSAPIQTGPVDNYRTPTKPTFHGIVGTDPENDGQHFAIQIAEDVAFTLNVLNFRSDTVRTGWQVNGYDIPELGVFNDQQGQPIAYTLQFDLDRNKTYFWRVAGVDAKTKARGVWSTVRRIRSGNELNFSIKNPINTATIAARRILFAADYQLPLDGTVKATIKVEFTNNALDVNPTWEDATAEFKSMDYYNFSNTEKTATEFAIGVRLLIKANDSMATIGIDAIGLTFD